MINKKGDAGLPTNKLIVAVLAGLVLVLVVVGIIYFDIPGKIRDWIPGLNSTTINNDLVVTGKISYYSKGDVKVLLDDGNARCIVLGYVDDNNKIVAPIGVFGLQKGKLLRKETAGWKDVDSDVANDDQIYLRGLKDKLQNAVNSISFNYNGKAIKVSLDFKEGLLATVDHVLYRYDGLFYYWDDKDKKADTDGWVKVGDPAPTSEDYKIQSLMMNSMPSVDGKKLIFDSRGIEIKTYLGTSSERVSLPKTKVIYFPKTFLGYYYGATKSASKEDIILAVKSDKDQYNFDIDWSKKIDKQDNYLYYDTIWENMMTKKTIKDDLIKICSSK